MANQKNIALLMAEKNGDYTTSFEMIYQVFSVIEKFLLDGEDVEIMGFGKFSVKHRAARVGVNPNTFEKINIEAKNVPVFKPSKGLKYKVN